MSEELDYSQNENALHGLSERDKIRTKIGMYAGSSGQDAFKTLLREPNDNSIDEWNYLNSIGEPFDTIKIRIDSKRNICAVRDYGRGIPYIKDKNGVSVLEKAVSILHMGGKHDNTSNHLIQENISGSKDNYSFSSGINGIGLSILTYSSKHFYTIVYNEDKQEKAYIKYNNGFLVGNEIVGLKDKLDIIDEDMKSDIFTEDFLENDLKRGTLILFQPSIKEDAFDDEAVFDEGIHFDKEVTINQLRTLPYLNPGLKIELNFDGEEIIFEKREAFEQVITDFNNDKPILDTVYFQEHMVYAQNRETKTAKVYSLEEFIKLPYSMRQTLKPIETVFELAFSFFEGRNPFQENNVNGSIIISGGKPLNALRNKMKEHINEYIAENFKSIGSFEAEDIMANFSFMFQVKINEPKFAGQTKDKLDNSELTQFANYFFKKYLKYWINREDKTKMSRLIKLLEANRKARLASDKIKDDVFKDVLNNSDDALLSNSTKLTRCKSREPEKCELYIVEGDSAAGPCKDSRVIEYQSVLPLKGKLINSLKTKNVSKLMKNQEVINLVTALGCGIGVAYDYSKLNYHKIIILSDKDIDGLNIRNLDLIFFYKFYRDLLEKGHVYIVDAPLFAIKTSNETLYAWSIEERNEITRSLGSKKYEVTRYKGLGEMNAEQLYDTCLNRLNRRLLQVTLSDFDGIDEIIEGEDYSNEELELLIHTYMNDRPEDMETRTALVAAHYEVTKNPIINLEKPF